MARNLDIEWVMRDLREQEQRERATESMRRLKRLRRNLRASANAFDLPDVEFVKNFRLSKSTVQRLYEEIEPYLVQRMRRDAISNMNKILTTLHFLGLGSYQRGVGNNFLLALSQPKVSQVLHEVVDVLNDPRMYTKYVQFPENIRDREAIQRGYYQKFGIPGVVGCIDCTHVALVRPTENEERFYCRKRYHSRNVQIICDSDLKIMNMDASYGGATHDSYIWRVHEVHRHMEELFDNGETAWLFGDAGYPLRPWLITPILDAPAGSPENHFYEQHCLLRNTVERCIGVLKARWRCLLAHRTLHYDPIMVGKIVYACGVLHNIANAARDIVPAIDEEDVIADRERQDNNYILPLHVARHLYQDLQLGVARRQQIVNRLWAQRQ